jgi:hypothetical protein
MQIKSWEGAALSRAETVLQGTTHDSVRAEIGYGEKVSQDGGGRSWKKGSVWRRGTEMRSTRKDAEFLSWRE